MIEEEVCHNPEAMRMLDQMTQSQHYFRATLPALERSVATTRATTEQRREAQPRQAATSSVQGMSESDYDAEYGRVFTLFKEAEAVNDGNAKARWSRELMQMAEARFKR
jgi:hypothetical protein